MDCTSPLRPAPQRRPQPAPWKDSYSVSSQHSHLSLSPHGWGHQLGRLEPLQCQDLLVQNALFTGDLDMVQKYFTKSSAINLIIETRGDALRWTSSKRGLWSLSYEQELTTPLHITAGRGYTECLRLLLLRGAAVDLAPGGRTALHEACAAASAACARLLLRAGADPEAVSEQGHRPLHLCKSSDSIGCVQELLQHGASVNSQTEEERDTALHVASRHGLAEHVQLLLRHGAQLELRNKEGQTPLNAACAQQHQPQEMDRYYRVCQLLVESGASVNAEDRDRQHPLHLACKNANAQIAELLLARGANVNVMNYGGNTALHNILQVLRCCHSCPRVIEALVNSYSHVRVSEDWLAAVPAEVVQTSLPAAPGSLCAQEPPGGPAAAGPVPAASAQCPAPVPAARLRGRSLLGVAVPVLLCLSVHMFHLPVQSVLWQLPPSPQSILPGHISPLCQACCWVPVPASLLLGIMHLFGSVLFVHANPDRLQTNKRRYGN
ncbi:ankyrin repeat and SOCS box protein 10 isoform X3 [Melospiza melodia melodia]|uniref:ankyrin repeat and SOCS box protein 10 isoform X3 n=1 Tax=Melospiza melodia melodia TaxID=1914991 RepID=UPI002FD0793E